MGVGEGGLPTGGGLRDGELRAEQLLAMQQKALSNV
jgi:hypothetical protein